MGSTMSLVLFGRQGSGKGTQCARLVEKFGLIHLSTGDILRENIRNKTELGLFVEPILSRGGLVDDATILALIEDRLEKSDIKESGFVLDGFPRTLAQSESLVKMLEPSSLDAVINLEVGIEEVTKRMELRGRSDDAAEAISQRLQLYETQTVPVIKWFDEKGLVATVDGVGSEDQVFSRIVSALSERGLEVAVS